MNTGQINAARAEPKKGPAIYIQICFIGVLSPPAITWTSAGGRDLMGLSEKEEIFAPRTLKDIKVIETPIPWTAPK